MTARSSLFLVLALGAVVPAHGRVYARTTPLDRPAAADCGCEKGGKGCTCPKGQCACDNCHPKRR